MEWRRKKNSMRTWIMRIKLMKMVFLERDWMMINQILRKMTIF
jgi:hypothetical protein